MMPPGHPSVFQLKSVTEQMPRILRIVLFVSLYSNQIVELTSISNFGILDLDGLCVFGETGLSKDSSEKQSDCTGRNCQVAVGIKKVSLHERVPQNVELLVNITPLGQSLQTLSKVYVTLRYPDDSESIHELSIVNLNGHHRDLLEKLQIGIPLDEQKVFLKKNQTVQLTVQSECSCNQMKDMQYLHLDDVTWSSTVPESNCNVESSGKHQWFLYVQSVCIVIGGGSFSMSAIFLLFLRCRGWDKRIIFQGKPKKLRESPFSEEIGSVSSHEKFCNPDNLEHHVYVMKDTGNFV